MLGFSLIPVYLLLISSCKHNQFYILQNCKYFVSTNSFFTPPSIYQWYKELHWDSFSIPYISYYCSPQIFSVCFSKAFVWICCCSLNASAHVISAQMSPMCPLSNKHLYSQASSLLTFLPGSFSSSPFLLKNIFRFLFGHSVWHSCKKKSSQRKPIFFSNPLFLHYVP